MELFVDDEVRKLVYGVVAHVGIEGIGKPAQGTKGVNPPNPHIFSSTFVWASTRRFSTAHTLTIGAAFTPARLFRLPRMVLPSTAKTCKPATQTMKHFSICSGMSLMKRT
jgi:hypothetical protein